MNNNISSSDLYYILLGYVVAIGIWALPKSQVASCHQDGWIPTLLGSIYPIIIILLSIYIISKHPNESILALSVKYYGKYLGQFLNILFFTFFFLIGIFILSGFTNVFIVYGVPFLSPIKIIGIGLILTGLAAYKGIHLLGKINKLVFYIFILLILLTIPAFWRGTYLNLQPMFSSSIPTIINGSIDTFYSYAGFEAILLIHTYVCDKENIKFKAFLAAFTVLLIYCYTVVVTIYYSGPDIVTKNIWPFVIVSESTELSIINNFRFIFSSTWILIALRSVSNYHYACSEILHNLFKKVKLQYIYILVYCLFLFFTMKLTDESFRRYVIDLVSMYYVIFNFVFISSIATFTFFKEGEKNEKK